MVKPETSSERSHRNADTVADTAALGQLLREAREAQGLSLEDVFEKTKLRPVLIRAIEDEQWHQLPSPVFVKGFLRTYAKLLNIDEGKILELYEARAPKDDRPFEAIVTKKQNRKSWWFALLILALGIVGATYWWVEQPPPGISKQSELSNITVTSSREGDKSQQGEGNGEISKGLTVSKKKSPDLKSTLAKPAAEPSRSAEQSSTLPTVSKKPPAHTEQSSPREAKANFVLKGSVTERTWIRIVVDEGPAKEYIFEPGSNPVWEAQHGFDIMVGNAAGINLKLNGKPLGSLGKRGKVVHIVLP